MTTEEKRNDEIDLIEVFLNIYLFFKKNFWFLFGAVILGAMLGYSTKFYTKKFYETSMLINSYTVSENLLKEYINNIQTILDDNNYAFLSDRMEMDSTELIEISSIEANFVYDEEEKKRLGYLSVHIKTNNNEVLKNLGEGISDYIEKEEYVQNEIEIFRENNLNIISKIDEEIEKLEQLQANMIKPLDKGGEVNIYNEQKSFQNEILSLIKERQTREKYVKFATPFRIVKNYTVYQKPKTKAKTYTLAGGLLFGFIAFSILIIKNINKSLKEKEAN